MRNFDFFASQVQLRFQGNRAYNTPIGQLFTFLIIAIVGARLIVMISDIYRRTEPVVLYKERFVESPQQFIMDSSTLPFAFGMEDGVTFQNYIDPSLYTIKAYQQTKQTIKNSEGTFQEKWTITNATIQRCTEDNFQNEATKSGFNKLPLKDLYCIKPENQQVIIEGDFTSENFSQFIIEVYPCQGQGCGDVKNLGKGFFTLYFQDIVVDPEDNLEPFKFFNKDLFWTTSTQFTQQAVMYFRNNYVYSDYGWIFSDVKTQRYISYSSQEVSLTFGTPYFLQLVMRYEKQKESIYTRSYLKLNDIFSQIGGFFQTMMAIGFILCGQLSNLTLNKSIINEAFNFQIFNGKNFFKQIPKGNQKIQENESNDCASKFDQIQRNSCSLSPVQSPPPLHQRQNILQKQFQSKIQKQSKSFVLVNKESQVNHKLEKRHNTIIVNQKNEQMQNSGNLQQVNQQKRNNQMLLSQIIQKKKTIILNKEISQMKQFDGRKENKEKSIIKSKQNELKEESQFQSMSNDKFKQLYKQETNSMQLNIWEYVKYFFWPFGEIKKKKQIIDYSIQKLYYHIDLIYLVKKFIEIEKLKQLLMDSDQIKLFEYLPKPTIREEDVFKKQDNTKEDQYKHQQDYNILYQDDRSEIKKLQDAYQAYLNIQNRGKQNQLDRKILTHLDPQLLNLFNYKSDQEEQNQSKFKQQVLNKQKEHSKIPNVQTLQRDMSLNRLKSPNQSKYLEDEKFFEIFSHCSIKHNDIINKLNHHEEIEDLDSDFQIPIEAKNQNKISQDYFLKNFQSSTLQ